MGVIKNENYALFRCRRALSYIVDQVVFLSCNSIDFAELDTLIGKAKLLGEEMSDILKATNEGIFSKIQIAILVTILRS